MKEWLFRPDNKQLRVLSISFRQSLSKYLAHAFEFNCYLESDFLEAESNTDRCVICLDSLWKVYDAGAEPYDVVVIDEALFVMHHFVSGTITDKLMDVIHAFRFYLSTARKVVIMQHRITENCISWYEGAIAFQPELWHSWAHSCRTYSA